MHSYRDIFVSSLNDVGFEGLFPISLDRKLLARKTTEKARKIF